MEHSSDRISVILVHVPLTNMLTACGMTTISFMNFMICVLY